MKMSIWSTNCMARERVRQIQINAQCMVEDFSIALRLHEELKPEVVGWKKEHAAESRSPLAGRGSSYTSSTTVGY